ncbi:MAG: pyruvate kinase, partial [Gammaproteobacteria bacterium]|nr:pyruvate kinase [Gammaproteobacteria bacterium]
MSDLWRRTKIVATLGPGSDDPDTIEALIQAGVNVFRLNFSHGLAEHHVVTAGHVRAISQRLDQPVAVLCDLQGPKIRIGQFADNQKPQLEVGDRFELSTLIDPLAGSNKGVYLEAWVLTDLAPKDRLLIDDGRLELEVQSLDDQCAVCVVRRGGIISGLKGVNKFGGGLSAPALTEKDFSDLKVAAELKTDYLAVSFVKSAEDVHLARQHLTS